MKVPIAVAGILLAILFLNDPSTGAELDDCRNTNEDYVKIDVCTEFINEVQPSDNLEGLSIGEIFDLQKAYDERGSAYIGLGLDNQGRPVSRSHLLLAWNDLSSALMMANEFERRNDIDLARENKSRALVRRAQVSQWLSEFDAALRDLNDALRLTPNSVWALSWRGHIFLAVNQPERAKNDFEKALRLDPNNLPSIHGLEEADKKLTKE